MILKIFVNSRAVTGLPADYAFADGDKIVFRAKRYKINCKLKSGAAEVGDMDMATSMQHFPAEGGNRIFAGMVSKFDDDSRPAVDAELVIGEGEYSVASPVAVDGFDGTPVTDDDGKVWVFTKA
jgi:hypothetical protein